MNDDELFGVHSNIEHPSNEYSFKFSLLKLIRKMIQILTFFCYLSMRSLYNTMNDDELFGVHSNIEHPSNEYSFKI